MNPYNNMLKTGDLSHGKTVYNASEVGTESLKKSMRNTIRLGGHKTPLRALKGV